jgi:FSR family fosmidomycin resistance protein-like MFS transporter
VILAISGIVLVSSFGVTVVMAQSVIPHRLGMVSGLMVGFAIGTGGVGVTLLGMIADHWGVPMALKTIFALPLAGFGLSLLLLSPGKKKETEAVVTP